MLSVLFYFLLNLISLLGLYLFVLGHWHFYFELIVLEIGVDNELVSLVEFFVMGRFLKDFHDNKGNEVAF